MGEGTIRLQPSTIDDRKRIYDALMHPDIKPSVFGPPTYAEIEAPDWEEFKADYVDHYFTGPPSAHGRCFIICRGDEFCGQVNYNQIYPDGVELDIWLASGKFLGQGIGSRAINMLCEVLFEKFDCHTYYLAPSARNIVAIRSYKKAGFSESRFIPSWFVPDYNDAVLLVRRIK